MAKCKLSIDMENNAEEWWAAAGRNRDRFPQSTQPLIDNTSDGEVIVSEETADAFDAVAETLPGWDSGPAYAPHPVHRCQV